MALWIEGGQTVEREVDGVTLTIKIMSAREMVAFLTKADALPERPDDSTIEVYVDLIMGGCTGWAGDGAPAFNREAVEGLSFRALERIMTAIIGENTMSEDEKGN